METIHVNSNYKTKLCKHWLVKNYCKYADACGFAHGKYELRPKMKKEEIRIKPNNKRDHNLMRSTSLFEKKKLMIYIKCQTQNTMNAII